MRWYAGLLPAWTGLHRLSLSEPAQELGIEVTQRAEVDMVTNTMEPDTLGTRDPFVMDLAIRDKTDPEVFTTDSDSSEVKFAHQVDGGFDGIHPEGTASLKFP